MNVEELVRDSLREQAAEQRPGGTGFADRVLAVRRRRRTRRLASVAAATAAVVAIAVAVPLLDSRQGRRAAREPAGRERHHRAPGPVAAARPDRGGERGAGRVLHVGRSSSADGRPRYLRPYLLAPRPEDRQVREGRPVVLRRRRPRHEDRRRTGAGAARPPDRAARPDHRARSSGGSRSTTESAGSRSRRDGRKLVATTYGENPDLRNVGDEHRGGRPVDAVASAAGPAGRASSSSTSPGAAEGACGAKVPVRPGHQRPRGLRVQP